MAVLIFRHPDGKEFKFPLKPGTSLTIGRKPGNNVVVEHLTVSGNHAKVDALEEGFLLSDLRSKNGTLVNGRPVMNSQWLTHGDSIEVGACRFDFFMEDEEGLSMEEDEEPLDATVVLNMHDLL